MATATAKQIEIENVGAIPRLTINLPDEGGVAVLRGPNGSGKSTGLEATERLLTNKGSVQVRDGQLNGKVKGLGYTLNVSRNPRRTGELQAEIVTLDGRLSVAELVDPGIKDPGAADAKRIKALVSLVETEATPELFYDLCGGRDEFDRLVSASAAEATDLLTMAARIKRDLEAKARDAEDQANHADGHARAGRESIEGVDLTAESDATVLQRAVEAAVRRDSELKSAQAAHARAKAAASEAQAKIDKQRLEYDGPSLAEAQAHEQAAREFTTAAREHVLECERKLAEARADYEAKTANEAAAIRARKQAEAHERSLAEWQKTLAASIPPAPTTDEVLTAAEALAEAHAAAEQGSKVRAAKEALAKADISAKAAAEHRKSAERLRNAARGTDDVLSSVVAKSSKLLRVEAGRLVLTTKRGLTYFADLSHGERWKIALDIAIEAVGKGGLITVVQEAWESLQPANRRLINEHLKGTGVVMLTAQADDGELRSEVFEG